MNREELKKAIAEIEKECIIKKNAIRIEFAKQNQRFKKGDVIEDEFLGRIIVDKVIYIYDHLRDEPSAEYIGVRVKKDNTPYKSGERLEIIERSCVKKIK